MTDTPPHLPPAAEPAGGAAHYVPSEGRASPGGEDLDEHAADTDDPTGHPDLRLDAAVLDALVGSVLDAACTPVHWALLDAFDAGAAWARLDSVHATPMTRQ